MAQYKVIGADETVENVDVRGVVHRPGDVVELASEDAAELVEAGVLELVGEADAPASAPADASPEAAPVADAPASEPAPEVPASAEGEVAPATDTTPPVDNGANAPA